MSLRYHEFRPLAPLAPYLASIWHLSGSGPASPDAALPDGRSELVLNSGDPFLYYGDGPPRLQPRILLVGQVTSPFHLRPGPRVDVVGFRFRAAGAHALLGLPMHEQTDRDIPLDALLPRLARRLERTLDIPDPSIRIAEASAILLRDVRRPAEGPIALAANAIAESHGRLRVDEVAVRLGLSSRQVIRRFAREIGVGPKLLGRIHRFQWFLGQAARRPDGSLTRLAHSAGYYDQSHLIRDFREFTQQSPSAFLGEDHPLGKSLAGL